MRALAAYPYNAFIWKAIEDACENGYSQFDFGRTSYAETGLFKFKMRWSTVEKKLYYSHFPADSAEKVINRTRVLLSTAKKCVRKFPLPLYKKISKRTFAFLG